MLIDYDTFPDGELSETVARQAQLLTTIQRRHASELIASRLAPHFYTSLDPADRAQLGEDTMPYVHRAWGMSDGVSHEWLNLSIGTIGGWTKSARNVFEPVAQRREGVVIPQAKYKDLPYHVVIDMVDELSGLVDSGELSAFDKDEFEIDFRKASSL